MVAAIIVVGVGLVLIRGRDGESTEFEPPFASAQMLRIVRDGTSLVVEDDEFVRALSGDMEIDEANARAALCMAGADWLGDYTLSASLVIGSDPALVRAAELYAAAIDDHDVEVAATITLVEQEYWRHQGDLADLESWAAEIADDDERTRVDRYLLQREQPPTATARGRFLSYAVPVTMSEQVIFYVDADRIEPARLAEPASDASRREIHIAGSERAIAGSLGDCDELAADWSRFRQELPDLPQLSERWEPSSIDG